MSDESQAEQPGRTARLYTLHPCPVCGRQFSVIVEEREAMQCCGLDLPKTEVTMLPPSVAEQPPHGYTPGMQT